MTSKPRCFVAFAFAAVALLSYGPGPTEAASSLDLLDIGLDFTEFCDLDVGAPISDKCYGFMGAVIEIIEFENMTWPKGKRHFPDTCIPRGPKIRDIVETIRPQFRRNILGCGGLCTSTSYVISSLAASYPCKE